MTSVFVVTELQGEYSQQWTTVKAVFTTKELADDYAAKMSALPEIKGESVPGDFEVSEVEVWDQPTERLMTFTIDESIGPGYPPGRHRAYRVEQYVPLGHQDLFREVVERNEREVDWLTIHVTKASRDECEASFKRLVEEHTSFRLRT